MHKFIRKNDRQDGSLPFDMLNAEASKKIAKENASYRHRYYANISVPASPFTFHIEVAFFPHCEAYSVQVVDILEVVYAKYVPSTFYDFDGCFAYAVDVAPVTTVDNRNWVPSDPCQAALENAWEHCLNGCVAFVNSRRLPDTTRIMAQLKNLIG